MTDEELRVRAIQELEFYKKDDTFMLADITVDLAIEALEQMPVTTTAGEGGVIYYPQVEGVTPTVIDAGKQEPCDNCKYLDGDGCRLVFEQAENGEASDECPNDNNELPSVNRKRCDDCIWSVCNYNKVDWESVTPQPKTGYWIFDDECKEHGHCSCCGYGSVDLVDGESHNFCRNCGAKLIVEPQERSEE